jgi:glycerophosphoryl diester phosphodiesterase
MDVRVTADGQLVLMHDSTVDRTTNGTGSVASMTLAQLKTLDAGFWFSPAFEGEPVPTMAEVVAASIAMDIEPLIERKTGTASVYHAEFLAESLASDEFRVIAFDWGFLDALDGLNPAYNLGALGSGTELTGMSVAQGYHLGDIDGSGEIDVVDFVLFKQRFEEANGAGSFAAMVAMPEPSTLQLLAGALLVSGTMSPSWCVISGRSFRCGRYHRRSS